MKYIALLLILTELPLFGIQSTLEVVRKGAFSKQFLMNLGNFERKLKRIIEDNRDLGSNVQIIGKNLSEERYEEITDLLALNEFRRKIKRGDLSSLEGKKFFVLKDKLERLGSHGPLLQEVMFEASYGLWKSEKRKEAVQMLENAIKLNPEGGGDLTGRWFEEAQDDDALLQLGVLAETIRAKIVRACEVKIVSTDPSQGITVDGFQIQSKKIYYFQTGKIYRIAQGVEFEPTLVNCAYQAKLQVFLSDRKEVFPKLRVLEDEKSILIVLHETRKKIHLDVFSQRGGAQKTVWSVPGERLLDEHLEDEPLRQILHHHLDRGLSPSRILSLLPNPHPQVSTLHESADPPIYKKWVFWTIIGALAVGTVTYLLVKNSESNVMGTNTTGIKLSLD